MSGNLSWDDHMTPLGTRPEKALWSNRSTIALIDSVKKRDVVRIRREDHNVSCVALFGSVQEDLMNEGFCFSISQIRNKWKKLKQHYYAKSENPSAYRSWRYFGSVHEILRHEVRKRRSTEPQQTIDAGRSESPSTADSSGSLEGGNVIFRILQKKEADCRTIREDSIVYHTIQQSKDCCLQKDKGVEVDENSSEEVKQLCHTIEDEDRPLQNGEEEADFIVETETPTCLSMGGVEHPDKEEHRPQNDTGVAMTMNALIKTIKEEHEKDRIAARENQQALISALNNVASSIQNSSRELITALHSSLT